MVAPACAGRGFRPSSAAMSDVEPLRELVEHCNDDIVALLREAKAAGLPLEQAVVLVLERKDPAGGAVAEACAALGQPLEDAEICVAGFPLDGAREILASVDEDLASRLHPSPPEGSAQLLCLAKGAILSLFLGIPGETKPEA